MQVSVDHRCRSRLSALVCTAASNDPKTSADHVKDGVKLLQKRSNPVELFVQKRVKHPLCHFPSKLNLPIHLVGIFKKISTICFLSAYSRVRNALSLDSFTLM